MSQQPNDHGYWNDDQEPHKSVLRLDRDDATYTENCKEGKKPSVTVT
jgi:hypothetical protein